MIDSFAGDVKATGFAATGANSIIADLSPKSFLEAALAENRRYMSRLDPRLVKPGLLPSVATVLLLGLRALPPPKGTAGTNGALAAAAGAASANGEARLTPV
jgi:hypothetical protein